MKTKILFICFVLSVLHIHAATYYFSSSSGNDSRTAAQAKNPATPWKTITKFNSLATSLQPGDSVLFKCGDVFDCAYTGIHVAVTGTSTSRIVFSSYGTGAQPVINGFSIVAGWTRVGTSNIWEADFYQPTGKENMVIMNNQEQPIGRYPNPGTTNGGYLNSDTTIGSNQITCYALPPTPNWTGADIVIRKNRWTLDRSPITSQSGTTLTFTPAGTALGGKNWGFFICNSPNTLDQNGEWWLDVSRSKLQMYFSDNNPNAYSVRASTVDTLVNMDKASTFFKSYITFNNISFLGANQYAIYSQNSDNIIIKNCTFNFSGIDAIYAGSAESHKIQNCIISNTNNCGVNYDWACNNSSILNDTVRNTGLISALGGDTAGGAARTGINVRGYGSLIQYCEVDSSGYDGIHFEGITNSANILSTVKNCYVNTFGLVADDGGGIYTGQASDDMTTQSKSILNNIVVNGIGFPQGTPYTEPAIHGIYLDGNTNHTTVMNNTAANCGTGVFANGSSNVDIINNTFFNNGGNKEGEDAGQQFLANRTSRTDVPSNVTFKKNICFPKAASQLAIRLQSYNGTNDLAQLGILDSNYYCRPLDSNYQFHTSYRDNANDQHDSAAYENLSSWRSFLGYDLHSKGTPATISLFGSSNLSGPNLFDNGSFTSNSNNVGVYAPLGFTTGWSPNKLDGGTLQISASTYTANPFIITMPTDDSVTLGQGYQLSFTLQGAVSGGYMVVYLKNQDYPNQEIPESSPLLTKIYIPIPTSRQNFKFGFIPTNFTGAISIAMDVPHPTGMFWIDNVVLQKATITPTNLDNYIVFQYNPTNTTKTFTLSGTYYDAKGATYSGSVTLQAYTSLVLFKQYTAPTSKMAQQSLLLAGNMVDASAASSPVNDKIATLAWKVDNENQSASYYEIQRSSDQKNFETIGRVGVKSSNIVGSTYQCQDAAPLAGKSFYRVVQHNTKDSISAISQTVAMKNISIMINPNPVKDIMYLSINGCELVSNHPNQEVQIHNASGVLMKTIQLALRDNVKKYAVNVSALQKGTYFLSLTSEGQTTSKIFIKQ